MKMSAGTIYWLLQIAGWGLIWFMNAAFASLGGGGVAGQNEWLTFGLCSLSGLVLTHTWRYYLLRTLLLEMRLARIVRDCVAGVLILGAVLTLLAGVWFRFFLVASTFQRVDWIPSALAIWTMVIAAWTALYVSIASSRRAGLLEKQRLQSDLLAREARLESLRMQLNPHFLFNSLNSLRALIFEDTLRASEMVDRIAALLRYSLQQSENSELVPLDDELKMVNEYLSIEKIRYEERLQMDWQIAEQARSALLPRMLIQTLVENAVKHGIEPAVSGGTIHIQAVREDGSLLVSVTNPGLLASGSGSTRLGLKNAEQRLSLLVGRGASLSIRQTGHQVVATVQVPQ